jgi:hypothetical protein
MDRAVLPTIVAHIATTLIVAVIVSMGRNIPINRPIRAVIPHGVRMVLHHDRDAEIDRDVHLAGLGTSRCRQHETQGPGCSDR